MKCSAMTRSWAPPTRYTLRRNTASIMKGLVWLESENTTQTGNLCSIIACKFCIQYANCSLHE